MFLSYAQRMTRRTEQSYQMSRLAFFLAFFFQSVLRWSVAVSTICRHSSRVVAFLQAVAMPKFRGPMSASIARSQVWLGLLLVASSRAVLVGYTLRVARSPVFSGSSRISTPISRLPDRSQDFPYLTRRSLDSEIRDVLLTANSAFNNFYRASAH